MADIQNVSITSTQTVTQPKPHTTYTVQVTTPIRTWTVQRRYNDFLSLHTELVSSTGKAPPTSLPPKHPWSLTRSAYDDKIIRERRVLLETYLRTILTSKDPRWRTAYTYSDFLAVPANTKSHGSGGPNAGSGQIHWTATNWLSEHSEIEGLLRKARSELLKRDALASMGDASGSRGASVGAKKLLRDIGDRVDALSRGLSDIAGGLGEGEKRRREELIEGLKNERGNLTRMAEAGVRTGFSRAAEVGAGGGGGGGGGGGTMPGGTGSIWGGPAQNVTAGRVFGKPQETAETRPLDDRGLLQLQQAKMDGQDGQLQELSKILLRQRGMGEEIHREIGEQNDLLDDIDHGVDKTTSKLSRAKREMNKLN